MIVIARYILGAGFVLAATAVSAGDLKPEESDGIMNACRSDYHRLCSGVVPGDGRVARCLLDHERELAPYCLQSLKIASAAEDCMPDYQRLCQGVLKGQQAFHCLADQMDRLAPSCRRVVAANAPYMEPRRDRYSDHGGPGPYGSPRPYDGPAPYPGGPYAYEGYAGPGKPQGPRYRGEPADDPAYAYPDGGRYADQGAPRYGFYGDGYLGGYPGPGPRAPY